MNELQPRSPGCERRLARPKDERGFTAVEWLVVALGVIVIAGIAVAAVQAFVTEQDQRAQLTLSVR